MKGSSHIVTASNNATSSFLSPSVYPAPRLPPAMPVLPGTWSPADAELLDGQCRDPPSALEGGASVSARLSASKDWWARMGESGPPCRPIVLKWIDPDPDVGGVPLTWADGPPPPRCTYRNGKSCAIPEHADFLDAEIAELIRCGVARPEAFDGEIIADYPMGVVPKHSLPGKPRRFRMIADERYVNEYMTRWSMSMRTIASRKFHLSAGRFVVAVDLKSAYWHLRADKTARRYQGFGWHAPPNPEDAAYLASLSPKGRQAARAQRPMQRYVFECLPFGSRQSPAAFGKLVRQLERRFEARGIDTIFYCDDLLFIFDSAEEAVTMMEGVIDDFDASGMTLNWPKCSGVSKADDGTVSITPLQRIQFLGFIIDLSGEFTTIAVTEERKAKAVAKIDDVLRRASCGEHIPARDLASIAGSLSSMSLAFGDVVRRRTRDIHAAIGRRRSWDGPLSRIEIGSLEADEMLFLRHLVETAHPSPLFRLAPSSMETSSYRQTQVSWASGPSSHHMSGTPQHTTRSSNLGPRASRRATTSTAPRSRSCTPYSAKAKT